MDLEWNDSQPIYRQLRDRVVAMKRRGLGMFVRIDARKLLLRDERQKFLAEEWPRISANIQRLGLKAEDLLNGATRRSNSKADKEQR
jgi:GntR family transcriptional regulator